MVAPGFVLWFTGLSGAGKSTLASLVAAELRARDVHVEVLDGDEVRTHLSKGLGFSREDRDTNIRRIGFVAKLIARAGGCAMTAAISPYRDVRDEQRQKIGRFVEVYLNCPVPVLSDRDPKGLYKKALAGEIQHFTGIDDPYEPPLSPEIVLDTSKLTPQECVARILETLERLGYLRRAEAPSETLSRPHGELPLIRPTDESAGLVAVETESVDAVRWIVSGFLAPLHGPLGSKDRTRIGKDHRLENGLVFDLDASVIAVRADAVEKGARMSLVEARSKRPLATLSVSEIYQAEDGATRIAGAIEASPLDEANSARRVREDLARRGGTVAGMFVDRPMHRGDAYLARAALESHDTLVVLVSGSGDVARAVRDAVERELPVGRVVVIEMPALPGTEKDAHPIARAVVLKNAGVGYVVARQEDAELVRAIRDARIELDLAVSPAVPTYVLPNGDVCSERTLPPEARGTRIE